MSIRGFDQWKTASPCDDHDDTVCARCGARLDDPEPGSPDYLWDGYCSAECEQDSQPTYGMPRPMANQLKVDFASADPAVIAKAIYKNTDCGAWITIEGDTVRIGSIVEAAGDPGSDAEIAADPLTWPFTAKEFWDAVEWVDAEACAAWDEANGEEGDA